MTCIKCDISINRKNIVWGFGKKPSDIMFIGDAPGYYEDKLGVPFVGESGKLLSTLLEQINLTRDLVYVTNLIRCRPPNSREPSILEIINCSEHLAKEVHEVNPKIIVTLGSTATGFFDTIRGTNITKYRGYPFVYGRRIILPMFHPSYVVRNTGDLINMENDFFLLSKLYSLFDPYYSI